MTHRSANTLLALLAFVVGARQAAAQTDSARDCDQAARLVRAYDQSAINSHGRAAQGAGKAEQRQMAVAQLLTCGAAAGPIAAATIDGARSVTDTSVLDELVSSFRVLRDTAVIRAVISVATDRTASTQARVFAIRSMWTLRTGRYWVGYDDMLPSAESTPAVLDGACGQGTHLSHENPRWYDGALPPAGYEQRLLQVAQQLASDTTESMVIRVAASCARLH